MMQCHYSSNSSSNDSSLLSNSPFPNEESFLHHSNSTPPPHNHHQCVATIKCQNSYTSSLLLHGKFLITGSSDKEIHIWEHSSLSSITKLVEGAAGKGAVKALLVTSDKIISAHQDHKIRIWKINFVDENHHKLTKLATLPTISDRALRVLVPKNHVRIRRHKKSTWIHHVDTVSALALSKDESLLYSVSWDKTMKIWRTKDFKCMESVANAHEDAINAIALSGDGFVYTASSDSKIKAWKKFPGDKKHSLVAALEKHDSGVNALALTEDGLVLFSGGSDRIITVWTKAVGGGGAMVAVAALRGHGEAVLCLTLVSDFIFSGSADKTVRIWKWAAGNLCCLAILEGHQGPVKCITAAFDKISRAHLLYSASLDCYIKAWQIFLTTD